MFNVQSSVRKNVEVALLIDSVIVGLIHEYDTNLVYLLFIMSSCRHHREFKFLRLIRDPTSIPNNVHPTGRITQFSSFRGGGLAEVCRA